MDENNTSKFATKKFTNREEWFETFNRLLADHNIAGLGVPRKNRIVCWYGDGGQGKSSLCFQLMKEITQRREKGEKIALALLDFDDPEFRDVKNATLRLRQEINLCRYVKFPTFDAAFAELFSRQSSRKDIRKEHPYLFRQTNNEFIEDLLDLANNVSGMAGYGFIPSIEILFKWGSLLTGHSFDWWEKRGTKELVAEMTQLSESGLRAHLPYYLGLDILAAMKEDDELQVVLMLDTFEALSPKQSPRASQWVKSLIKAMPGALVAIFGRDQARWLDDEEFTSSIEFHLLKGLSDSDANRFLTGEGITEQNIRARIVKMSDGVPFYLDIAVDDYRKMVEAGKRLVPENFGQTKTEVLERFLDHLSESERQEILYASYPNDLTKELFLAMSAKFLGDMFALNWSRLTERSFIEVRTNGNVRVHRLMKEHLQNRDRSDNPMRYEMMHKWLFGVYEKIAFGASTPLDITETNDIALISATYHLSQFEPQTLLSWFHSEKFNGFFEAARWSALSESITWIETTLDQQQDILPDELARLNFSSGHIYQRTGEFKKAAEQFEAALVQQLRATGHEEAHTLQALANVLLAMGTDLERAENLLNGARVIYSQESTVKHIGLANCLVGLAVVGQRKGNTDNAVSLLEHAKQIFHSQVDETNIEYFRFLIRVHEVYLECKKPDHAVRELKEARDILEENEKIDEIIYALILVLWEGCPGRKREEGDSAPRLQALVDTCERICGKEHPTFGWALFLQAKTNTFSKADFGDVVSQLQQSLNILEQACGSHNHSTMAVHKYLEQVKAS